MQFGRIQRLDFTAVCFVAAALFIAAPMRSLINCWIVNNNKNRLDASSAFSSQTFVRQQKHVKGWRCRRSTCPSNFIAHISMSYDRTNRQ